jgi:WD repeat-containing protein 68
MQKQDIKTHLIAHDSEVFDINFGANENTFISTGADGSIRLFDLRALDTCSVLFESQDQTPITRVSWNNNDNNYIAAATQDKNFIFIIDVRVLNTPIAYLTYHTNLINAVAWAPSSYSHICSVSDDKTALIWDIQMIENRTEDPILSFKAESEINNCVWSYPYEDWIAINAGNVVKMLKVI